MPPPRTGLSSQCRRLGPVTIGGSTVVGVGAGVGAVVGVGAGVPGGFGVVVGFGSGFFVVVLVEAVALGFGAGDGAVAVGAEGGLRSLFG